jgi:hypothetical protein
VNNLELLSKTQLVWLASQLLLDIEYVQNVYSKKLNDFRAFLKSSIMMHLHNIGRIITKREISEPNIPDRAEVINQINAEMLETLAVPSVQNLQAVPLVKRQLDQVADDETINVALKPKEPFQFLRTASQAPYKFCSLKRVPSNPNFSDLKCTTDPESHCSTVSSQHSLPLVGSLARPELFVELSKLGRSEDSEPPLSLWSDRMGIGTKTRQKAKEDKNLVNVNWKVEGINFYFLLITSYLLTIIRY